ncbi:MAG: right-handed parallel beta-helix repeat-containing protein [Anaerolineae bacterium]
MKAYRWWFVALFLALALAPSVLAENAGVREVWVDDSYCAQCTNDGHTWGVDAFASIGAGLRGVAAGGTVNVLPGRYEEDVEITQPCRLLAVGDGPVVVRPRASQVAVTVAANDVTVQGLEIGGSKFAAVLVVGPGFQREPIRSVIIRDNIIHGGQYGIAVNIDGQRSYGLLKATGVDIRGNQVTGCKRSIYVYNSQATITGNKVADVLEGGIGIYSSRGSTSRIRQNSVRVDAAGARGIYVLENDGTAIDDNTLVGVSDYLTPTTAIALYGYQNLRLTGNTVRGFYWGTNVYTGGTARVVGNTFEDSGAWALSFGTAITTTTVTIEDNVVRGAYWGLRLDNGGGYGLQAWVRGNTFTGNIIGIQLGEGLDSNQLEIAGNALCGNLVVALRNEGTNAVDASHNWWGANSGPGPRGSGDRIEGAGAVQVAPWLQLSASSSRGKDGLATLTATLGNSRIRMQQQEIVFSTNTGAFLQSGAATYVTKTDRRGEATADLALPVGGIALVTVGPPCGASVMVAVR